jgi:hypothetical protein
MSHVWRCSIKRCAGPNLHHVTVTVRGPQSCSSHTGSNINCAVGHHHADLLRRSSLQQGQLPRLVIDALGACDACLFLTNVEQLRLNCVNQHVKNGQLQLLGHEGSSVVAASGNSRQHLDFACAPTCFCILLHTTNSNSQASHCHWHTRPDSGGKHLLWRQQLEALSPHGPSTGRHCQLPTNVSYNSSD